MIGEFGRHSRIPPIREGRLEKVHVDFMSTIGRDLQLLEATGRWSFTRAPQRQPSRFVPGDVLALRGKAVFDYVMTAHEPDDTPAMAFDALALGSILTSAVPYWLPPSGIAAVLESEPPESTADLALPYPAVSVWFAEPVIPSARLASPALAALPASPEWAGVSTASPDPHFLLTKTVDALATADRDLDRARLEGVALLADANGEPSDVVIWIVAVYGESRMPERIPIPARTSLAGWRGPLELLAAIVAWGDWHPPADPIELSARPTRDELRGLRHGRTRRQEEAGALAGVLVLDAQRRAARHRPSEGTHASPATHLRRGHYQRYRHGPNEDWHYETHWIPPLVVNPDGRGDARPRVYRLPPPAD